MTNEEAINTFKEWIERDKKMEYADRLENIEIYNMAIQALEQQTCEDCISRQAVEDAIYDATRSMDLNYGQIIDYIDKLPSVTPQPKRGHWIDMGDFEKCSVCNGTHLKEFQNFYGKGIWVKTNYCPNCGAKMEEVEE